MFHFLRKKRTIRESVVRSSAKLVQEYAEWYPCHGLALPPKYARDPSAWNNALAKMARSFELLLDDMEGKGEYYEAKNKWIAWNERDIEAEKNIEEQINEGLTLFGENLLYLTDIPK